MMNVYAYTPAPRGLPGPRVSCSCGGRSSRTLIMVTLPRVVASQFDVDGVGVSLPPQPFRLNRQDTDRTRTSRPIGPTDPAFSRNPKPPPLGGGVFTLPSRMTKASPLTGYLPAKL
jgi:hypothetical protein